MNRRDFITFSSSMTLLSLHSSWMNKTTNFIYPPATDSKSTILYLELHTAPDPVEMKTFYHQSLGLSIRSENNDHIEFVAGATAIRFIKSDQPGISPFYHFAFNIPENKILSAGIGNSKDLP